MQFDSTNDSQSTLFGQQRSNFIGGTMSGAASTVGGDDDEDDDDEMSGISIQTAQDGTLKVSCEDPEMLAVRFVVQNIFLFSLNSGSSTSTHRVFDSTSKPHDVGRARRAQGASQIDAAAIKFGGRFEWRFVDCVGNASQRHYRQRSAAFCCQQH